MNRAEKTNMSIHVMIVRRQSSCRHDGPLIRYLIERSGILPALIDRLQFLENPKTAKRWMTEGPMLVFERVLKAEARRINAIPDIRRDTVVSFATAAKLFGIPAGLLRDWLTSHEHPKPSGMEFMPLRALCSFVIGSTKTLKIIELELSIAKQIERLSVFTNVNLAISITHPSTCGPRSQVSPLQEDQR